MKNNSTSILTPPAASSPHLCTFNFSGHTTQYFRSIASDLLRRPALRVKVCVTRSCPGLVGVKEKLLRSAGKHLDQLLYVCGLMAL